MCSAAQRWHLLVGNRHATGSYWEAAKFQLSTSSTGPTLDILNNEWVSPRAGVQRPLPPQYKLIYNTANTSNDPGYLWDFTYIFKMSTCLCKGNSRSNCIHGVLGPNANPDFDSKIRRLTDMGVDGDQARVALSTYNWDLMRATEQLFS